MFSPLEMKKARETGLCRFADLPEDSMRRGKNELLDFEKWC
jgi:hypothetical protein